MKIRESVCPECGKIFQSTSKPEVALARTYHMQEAHGASGPVSYTAHPLRSRERELAKYKARYSNPVPESYWEKYTARVLEFMNIMSTIGEGQRESTIPANLRKELRDAAIRLEQAQRSITQHSDYSSADAVRQLDIYDRVQADTFNPTRTTLRPYKYRRNPIPALALAAISGIGIGAGATAGGILVTELAKRKNPHEDLSPEELEALQYSQTSRIDLRAMPWSREGSIRQGAAYWLTQKGYLKRGKLTQLGNAALMHNEGLSIFPSRNPAIPYQEFVHKGGITEMSKGGVIVNPSQKAQQNTLMWAVGALVVLFFSKDMLPK